MPFSITPPKTPQEIYDKFWKELVENPDGTLNKEAVMKELCDFHHMIQEVPKVYGYVTGGLLSYPMYFAKDVIECHEDYLERKEEESGCPMPRYKGVCDDCNGCGE
jgi:hypothetical protein